MYDKSQKLFLQLHRARSTKKKFSAVVVNERTCGVFRLPTVIHFIPSVFYKARARESSRRVRWHGCWRTKAI